MPALLMYYWQMKLHCKLFNLNNLDASDVKILVFAILYVKYEAFQAHTLYVFLFVHVLGSTFSRAPDSIHSGRAPSSEPSMSTLVIFVTQVAAL